MPSAGQALQLLAAGLAGAKSARGASGEAGDKAFLQSLAHTVNRALEADYVVVGQVDTEYATVQALVVSARGEPGEPFCYSLEGTPCATVVQRRIRTYRCDVRSLFPDSTTMSDLEIEGYVGVPLWDSAERPLGLMAALYCRPVPEVELAESLLNIIAAQCAAEVERFVAEQASEVKSRFLANMSHEIRTPVSAIIGLARLLEKTELGPHQQEYVKVLATTADGLLHLVDDILDLSKIEAEKLSIEMADFNPGELLDDVAELFLPQARDRGIELQLEVGPELRRTFRSDPARLRQVLINLVGNAVKFTEEGKVTLRAEIERREGHRRWARLEVADTGIGIAPEVRPMLFKPFVQADDSTPRRFGGTGLGLAICRRVVELLEGEIGVDSRLGRGSRFFFSWPLDPPRADGAAAPDTAAADTEIRQPDRYRLLLAEDNLANRLVAVRLLESLGYRVEAVENGHEALKALAERHFDLVFMDCQMPVLDGFEATRRLRRNEAGRRVPIVALTANALKGDRERCLAAGMDDYIAKPFREEAITAVLGRLLGD